MVKVGDRIRILKDRANGASVQKGDEFIVSSLEGGGTVTVEDSRNWMFNKESYIVISQPVYSIPADTETVTLKYADGSTQDINVKDRARGVPEWVKDGAWVVRKVNGYIHQVKEAKPGIFHLTIDSEHSIRITHHIYGQYRPFTNSDWKWGMWAEYRGEKVFVCSSAMVGHVGISRSPENTGELPKIAYISGVPASELTPTTAP